MLRAVPLLQLVLEEWHKVFRIEIPSAEVPIMRGIEEVGQQYLEELKDQIEMAAPNIMPSFEEIEQTIDGIMKEMRDKVHAALKALSECSSEVHPQFLGLIRSQLAPIFEESREFTGMCCRLYKPNCPIPRD